MKTNDNGRALARSRASERLRTLTIGTALLGVAATGGFGWLAAVTSGGTSAGPTTAAVGRHGRTTATTSGGSGFSGAGAPGVTSAGGTGHATTGGS